MTSPLEPGQPLPEPLPPARARRPRAAIAVTAAALAGLIAAVVLLAAVQLGSPGATATPTRAAASQTPSPRPTGSPGTTAAGSPGATGSPATGGPPGLAAAVRDITDQVAAIRGLEPTGAVTTRVLTSAEFRARVEADFREQNSPAYLEASNELYRRLELIPADADLEELTLELLEASVIGVYFPEEREMAVVGDVTTIGALEKFTLAHEIDHALQDQHFGLHDTLLIEQASTETDRTLARQALIEGDATQLMLEWAVRHLTPAEFLEVTAAGLDPEDQEVLARMPPILQRQLAFPYIDGQGFIAAAHGSGGWPAVDELWVDPPDSTEQILHPERYAARDAPVDVTMPDLGGPLGAGWTRTLEDTFGELQAQVFLDELSPETDALDAAAGWGGDRLETWEGPDGQWAIVWLTAWDTPSDAREFVSAASRATDALDDPLTIIHDQGSDSAVFIAASESLLLDRVAAVFDSI